MMHPAFAEISASADRIEQWWFQLLPSIPKPERQQFEIWARIHADDLTRLRRGMDVAVERLRKRPFNDAEHPIRFISAVANSLRKVAA
jgi:hypothetical protein